MTDLKAIAEKLLDGVQCGDRGCAVCPECEAERARRIASALRTVQREALEEGFNAGFDAWVFDTGVTCGEALETWLRERQVGVANS